MVVGMVFYIDYGIEEILFVISLFDYFMVWDLLIYYF